MIKVKNMFPIANLQQKRGQKCLTPQWATASKCGKCGSRNLKGVFHGFREISFRRRFGGPKKPKK